MKTPYFLIKQDELQKNIDEFKIALADIWPNSQLAYSVKTNSLPWVLRYMRSNNVYAEVVSDEEYELSQICGFDDENIIFNGPIKSKNLFNRAVKNGATVNIDSQSDLNALLDMNISDISNVGVRINVDTSVFEPEDIGYEEDGFRFGFSEENGSLGIVINNLKEKFADSSFGLHLHCNSKTRSLNVYKSVAEYANMIISRYNLEPSFIDMGGGFFGGVEGKPTANHYISLIKTILSKTVDINITKLYIEPGSAIIGSIVDYHTSVIDVKKTNRACIVTTDGSRIHIDPLWAKTGYKYSIDTKSSITVPKQIICGYTCMDHDRLMAIENQALLNVGDKIIYHRVGAYSMTFGGMFIRYYPEVWVDYSDEMELVRERTNVYEYYKIQHKE